MSNRLPSRKTSLSRAKEISEMLKDQFGIADDIYDNVREVVDTEDASISDDQLADAVERMSAETIDFEDQRKALSAELEDFNEEGKALATEWEILTMELQKTPLTDEEPHQSTKDLLAQIKRLFEVDTKLAALVFQDQPLFQDTIRDIKSQGQQLQTKMHYVLEDV